MPVADGPAQAAFGPETAEDRFGASPDWLAARRRAAWDAYEALPIPSSHRDEDWRRTDIGALHLERFQALDTVAPEVVAAMRRQRDSAAPNAAFAFDAPAALPVIENADSLVAQGVIVTTLAEAAGRHPDLVQRALSAVSVELRPKASLRLAPHSAHAWEPRTISPSRSQRPYSSY